jgi:RNA polymerase sigma-70 factor (ECF subfamily)
LRNRDDADDIVQEVFAKVSFSITHFGGRGSLYGRMYRIAANECMDCCARNDSSWFTQAISPDDTLPPLLYAIADVRPTPDRIAMQRDFINKLLARIPEHDRWLLISKEVEGFSLAELSEMTGLNENTIKVRLFRVRQGLVATAARLRSQRRSIDGRSMQAVAKLLTVRPRFRAHDTVRELPLDFETQTPTATPLARTSLTPP